MLHVHECLQLIKLKSNLVGVEHHLEILEIEPLLPLFLLQGVDVVVFGVVPDAVKFTARIQQDGG